MVKPCLRWDGRHRKSDGRPVTSEANPRYVYRLVHEREVGPIPPGHVIDHLCENAWCIEPTHLEAKTQAQHIRDEIARGTIQMGDANVGQAKKTHCPRGHAYDEVNTYQYQRRNGSNERLCRECVRTNKRARRARGLKD